MGQTQLKQRPNTATLIHMKAGYKLCTSDSCAIALFFVYTFANVWNVFGMTSLIIVSVLENAKCPKMGCFFLVGATKLRMQAEQTICTPCYGSLWVAIWIFILCDKEVYMDPHNNQRIRQTMINGSMTAGH